jgi:hypothetical protein
MIKDPIPAWRFEFRAFSVRLSVVALCRLRTAASWQQLLESDI